MFLDLLMDKTSIKDDLSALLELVFYRPNALSVTKSTNGKQPPHPTPYDRQYLLHR